MEEDGRSMRRRRVLPSCSIPCATASAATVYGHQSAPRAARSRPSRARPLPPTCSTPHGCSGRRSGGGERIPRPTGGGVADGNEPALAGTQTARSAAACKRWGQDRQFQRPNAAAPDGGDAEQHQQVCRRGPTSPRRVPRAVGPPRRRRGPPRSRRSRLPQRRPTAPQATGPSPARPRWWRSSAPPWPRTPLTAWCTDHNDCSSQPQKYKLAREGCSGRSSREPRSNTRVQGVQGVKGLERASGLFDNIYNGRTRRSKIFPKRGRSSLGHLQPPAPPAASCHRPIAKQITARTAGDTGGATQGGGVFRAESQTSARARCWHWP